VDNDAMLASRDAGSARNTEYDFRGFETAGVGEVARRSGRYLLTTVTTVTPLFLFVPKAHIIQRFWFFLLFLVCALSV